MPTLEVDPSAEEPSSLSLSANIVHVTNDASLVPDMNGTSDPSSPVANTKGTSDPPFTNINHGTSDTNVLSPESPVLPPAVAVGSASKHKRKSKSLNNITSKKKKSKRAEISDADLAAQLNKVSPSNIIDDALCITITTDDEEGGRKR